MLSKRHVGFAAMADSVWIPAFAGTTVFLVRRRDPAVAGTTVFLVRGRDPAVAGTTGFPVR